MEKSPIRIPGFIDAHVHIESSHLVPEEFGRLLLHHGTVGAVCDPHEIVNVAGEAGLRFMLESAKKSPCSLYFELPSCVPATPFETSGAVLGAAATAELFDRYPELVGFGEMMDFSGVLAGDPEVMKKIEAARIRGKVIDGHFPCGRGDALKKYAAAGISSDHESVEPEEVREKLACGQMIFLREGSAARNLENLLEAVTPENADRFCFCADDISAADLLEGGDILRCVRKAVALGLDPQLALQIACDNPRRFFHLPEEPDTFVLVEDLIDFSIVKVVKNGQEFR
ncbi:MAG: amidohydrolase family protein [Victivallaceae bacterium]|nr:amidohydrolase family protein [Victivallaceae bacterium]